MKVHQKPHHHPKPPIDSNDPKRQAGKPLLKTTDSWKNVRGGGVLGCWLVCCVGVYLFYMEIMPNLVKSKPLNMVYI